MTLFFCRKPDHPRFFPVCNSAAAFLFAIVVIFATLPAPSVLAPAMCRIIDKRLCGFQIARSPNGTVPRFYGSTGIIRGGGMRSEHPGGRTVLIAERDQNVRELQRFFLEKAGFSVDFADDGEAALERARLTLPAAVVTEILIPRLDGLALCRRLREDPLTARIPVIVFSILAAAARASEAGARAFLRKPFVESTFVVAVQELVAAHPSAALEEQWTST
jgi:CheY-like chemotaxis protein